MAIKREQVVQTAEKYVQRGKIEPAIREYKKLLEENPNDINTLNRVGDLYARIQRIDEAIDFFTQIAEQYSGEGFFVKAIAIYKKIIKLDPTRIDVYESLAELYHRQGLVNEARTQYQVLADYYLKHENATSAIAIYQKTADLEPDNPSHRVKLAELYQQQKLTEKALVEYRLIAELMLRHGRGAEAARVYERALDLDIDNQDFLADAARTLESAGHEALALRFIESAVERNPQSREVLARFQARTAHGPAAAPVPQPVAPPAAVPAPSAAPPAAPLETGTLGDSRRFAEPEPPAYTALPPEEEIEIDLDASFVLELEGDDAPASLVQPPPDMLAGGPRLPAWAQGPGDVLADEPIPPLSPRALWRGPEVDLEEPEDGAGLGGGGGLPTLEDFDDGGFTLPEIELEDPLAGLERDLFVPSFGGGSEPDAEPEPPAPPMLRIDPDVLERTAADLHPAPQEHEEDLISEAEVLAKYGLEEKALDRLREALRINPRSVAAIGLTIQLQLAQRRVARVVELANQMAQISAETGDREPWIKITRRLLAAGYRIEGNQVWAPISAGEEAVPAAGSPFEAPSEPGPAEAAPAGEVEDELVLELDLDEIGEIDPQLLEPSTIDREPVFEVVEDPVPPPPERQPVLEIPEELEPAFELLEEAGPAFEIELEPVFEAIPEPVLPPPAEPVAEKPAERPVRRPRDGGLDKMLAGLLDPKLTSRPRPPKAAPPAVAPAPPPSVAAEPATLPEPVQAAPVEAPPEPPLPAPPPARAPMGLFDPTEISALVESEDIDWGDEISDSTSGLGQSTSRGEPAEAVAPRAPVVPAGPSAAAGAPTDASAKALDDTNMSWLDEADARRPRPDGAGSPLSDEDDDFFDLAGQIEQELSQEGEFAEADFHTTPQEQSLEEIVEGFKRGVSEHLSPTDYDTHFNLGIAYREMGLIDEAVGEFQLSVEDAGHLVASCSMLGLCFLDKGLPEVAAHWFRKGLEAPNLPPEEYMGMLYDLGTAYQAQGDRDNAHKMFMEIYGLDTEYRDIGEKLQELG
jgi:pilus assembly protein FimV